MIAANDEIPPIAPRGKFLSRRGEKFFFKALRLNPASCPLDFNQKIAMRKRLADLRAAHTTAMVIAEATAEALLDLASQAGLYALVEIDLAPEDLLSRSSLRAAPGWDPEPRRNRRTSARAPAAAGARAP